MAKKTVHNIRVLVEQERKYVFESPVEKDEAIRLVLAGDYHEKIIIWDAHDGIFRVWDEEAVAWRS